MDYKDKICIDITDNGRFYYLDKVICYEKLFGVLLNYYAKKIRDCSLYVF